MVGIFSLPTSHYLTSILTLSVLLEAASIAGGPFSRACVHSSSETSMHVICATGLLVSKPVWPCFRGRGGTSNLSLKRLCPVTMAAHNQWWWDSAGKEVASWGWDCEFVFPRVCYVWSICQISFRCVEMQQPHSLLPGKFIFWSLGLGFLKRYFLLLWGKGGN